MTTPLEIITSALTEIGVVPIGETVPSHLSTMGLAELNSLLQLWSIEGMNIPTFTIDALTLVVSKSSYTIVTAGDFNVTRPVKIESAYIRDASGVDSGLDVYNDLHRYNSYTSKSTEGKPYEIYYDALNPNGKIYFYLTPDYAYSLYLTSEKYLTEFATTGETITLPPEYKMALTLNLAVHLMSKFGKNDQFVMAKAQRSLDALIVNNSKRYIEESSFDVEILRSLYR